MLSPNVIIPYDGTHASVPAGFTRDTRFDGKFPKGVATGFGDSGGATTHTHTSPTHYHTDSHTHTFTTAAVGGTDGSHQGGNSLIAGHAHSGTTGSVSNGNTNSLAVTYDSVSNNPPYYTVIFIKSSGYNFIPANGMVFRQSGRTGLTYHSASENKFLMGATTGANAGDTGGSTTNAHVITHSHTASAHGHNSVNITAISGGADYSFGGGDGGNWAGNGHAHSTSFGNDTATVGNSAITLTTTETVEPSHCKIRHYKASAKIIPIPGDIALTTETTPPVGWIVCDGNNGTPNMQNYYVKNVDDTFSNGSGANSHTHAAQAHSHTGSSHSSHSMTIAATSETGSKSNLEPRNPLTTGNHGHSSGTMNSASSAYQNSNTTADSSSNEPEYVKVQFIQYKFNPLGGGIMLL